MQRLTGVPGGAAHRANGADTDAAVLGSNMRETIGAAYLVSRATIEAVSRGLREGRTNRLRRQIPFRVAHSE